MRGNAAMPQFEANSLATRASLLTESPHMAGAPRSR